MESFDIDRIDWEEVKEYFSNLKNWFSLENYDYIKRLSRRGLSDLITGKKIVYSLSDSLSPFDIPLVWFVELVNSKYTFHRIDQDISDIEEDESNCAIKTITPQRHIGLFKEIYDSIDNQTPKKQLLEAIKEQDRDKYLQIMLINYRDPLPEVKTYDTAYLEIDLAYSDEAIINSLKKKLPQIREQAPLQYKNPRKISDTEIRNLLNQNIIPCMDLLLWQRLTGKKLTDQKMFDLIFPYGVIALDNGEEKEIGLDSFRKTVKPKAEKLLSGEYKRFA